MNVLIKKKYELEVIKEGGSVLAEIFSELKKYVVVDSNSLEIDKYANYLCKKFKVRPAFLGYKGFPFTICANLNEVVVHGFPNKIKFKNGDIFGLDMGIVYYGFYLDMSLTVEIGKVSSDVSNFVSKTKKSMEQGIAAAIPGNKIGDISAALREGLVGDDFQLMRDFVGHGIGYNLHEEPEIPGDGMERGEGVTIKPGMVFAIESISVMGPSNEYEVSKDGWTVYTKNRKYLSALFEHTVIITENGPEIVTNFN